MFLDPSVLASVSWQAFERLVCRLLMCDGFDAVRTVGQSGDGGADLLARRSGKRWLFQIKRWKAAVGLATIDETLRATTLYAAQIPVIVAMKGFDTKAREHQIRLQSEKVPLQLWDRHTLLTRAQAIGDAEPAARAGFRFHQYQEDAVQAVVRTFERGESRRALVVMATGLGKTYVAAEAIRRMNALRPLRVLAIAHTNELVYQLERSFWPFLRGSQGTAVWNGLENPGLKQLTQSSFVFACLPTVAEALKRGEELPHFDILLIDECHHVGAAMYDSVLTETRAGHDGGAFLLGLTATPWRADDVDLTKYFGEPLISVDLVTGLKKGFLTNVDYRMYTDNIDWAALKTLKGEQLSPRSINRTLFISEWDDGVVTHLQKAWAEQTKPRAIVFCGTIDHAIMMRDRINARGFCSAKAVYSQGVGGQKMLPYERNRILCDFQDNVVNAVCAVDILNEGVDVPDVNIIVFQRVTHSRRIFIQQLGRGLRIAPDKDRVIVLDFVSDIRRFAAGLELKDQLASPRDVTHLTLHNNVTFMNLGDHDPQTESFLREWLHDIAAVEDAGEDAAVLRFPPPVPGAHQ